MAIKQQINIIKMTILLKDILTQCISIKISILFFMKQKKKTLKFQILKAILSKSSSAGGITEFGSKMDSRAATKA